ncbi:MAG: VanZ family protein [Spirochaetales bacterium]|nr:VanZ family protein [Spirochaetales bacterium]
MAVKPIRHAITAFWVLTITALSAVPGYTFEDPIYNYFGIDKIGHMGLYFLLTRSFLKSTGKEKADWSSLILALSLALGWGGLMELMQSLEIIGRSSDWRDMLANLAGALLALAAFAGIQSFKNNRRKKAAT